MFPKGFWDQTVFIQCVQRAECVVFTSLIPGGTDGAFTSTSYPTLLLLIYHHGSPTCGRRRAGDWFTRYKLRMDISIMRRFVIHDNATSQRSRKRNAFREPVVCGCFNNCVREKKKKINAGEIWWKCETLDRDAVSRRASICGSADSNRGPAALSLSVSPKAGSNPSDLMRRFAFQPWDAFPEVSGMNIKWEQQVRVQAEPQLHSAT